MADTDNTPIDLEEVSATLSKIKSLLFIITDSGDITDDTESLMGALATMTDMVIDSGESIDKFIQLDNSRTRAYPKWFEETLNTNHEKQYEDWHPMLKNFIEQASNHIGDLTRDKSKQKLIEAASPKLNNKVEDVISQLKNEIDEARPFILDIAGFNLLESLYKAQRNNIDIMIQEARNLRERLVACDDAVLRKTEAPA